MTELLYYAYGSNMYSKWLRQEDRVPSAIFVTTAYISCYRMCFNKRSIDKSGKGNINKSGNPKHFVHGVVYKINISEKPKLDKAEGLGSGYCSAIIRVTCSDKNCMVDTYLAVPDFVDDSLLPYDWYKELVLAGAREHSLPVDYIAALAKVRSIRDSNIERRNKAYRILKA